MSRGSRPLSFALIVKKRREGRRGGKADYRRPATGKVLPVSPHSWQGEQDSNVSPVAGNDSFAIALGDRAGRERSSLPESDKPAVDSVRDTPSRHALCKVGGQVGTVDDRQTRQSAHNSPHDGRPSPPRRR